ncbi:hypothetical protein [Alteromonas flava]|uniref:hypothetical protein n=1 Tax=Alteromonas flava TaxID=2048003 RepID=UPI000C28BC57|nr:hypothetical protein [Alteromonas flava]
MLRLLSAVTLFSLLAVFSSENSRWHINVDENLTINSFDNQAIGNDTSESDTEEFNALVFDYRLLSLDNVSPQVEFGFKAPPNLQPALPSIRGPPFSA